MALKFCDSFDAANTATDLTKKWFSVGTGWTWASGVGRFGGGAAVNSGAASGNILQMHPGTVGNQGNVAMGAYFKFSGNPAANTIFCRFVRNDGTSQATMTLNTTGTITHAGSASGSGTSGNIVTDGNWHWVEWYYNSTGGNTNLYIDNINQGSGGGANSIAIDYVNLLSVAGLTMSVDDIIVYDSTAGVNTGSYPLSSRQITVLRPVSDGTVQYATTLGGTGTHASCVNEVSPDGNTSYVQDGTTGNTDLYNMSTLSYTPTSITAVMANIYVSNPNAGTININAVCHSGTVTSAAIAIATPLTYVTEQFSFPTDPNTSAAWTPTGLAAAQFGPRNA